MRVIPAAGIKRQRHDQSSVGMEMIQSESSPDSLERSLPMPVLSRSDSANLIALVGGFDVATAEVVRVLESPPKTAPVTSAMAIVWTNYNNRQEELVEEMTAACDHARSVAVKHDANALI